MIDVPSISTAVLTGSGTAILVAVAVVVAIRMGIRLFGEGDYAARGEQRNGLYGNGPGTYDAGPSFGPGKN